MAIKEIVDHSYIPRRNPECEGQLLSQLSLIPLRIDNWEWNAISRSSFVINTMINKKDFVIKVPRPEVKVGPNFAHENKGDYELLKQYLEPYIPTTYFIQSASNHGIGYGSSIIVQERVPGIPLADVEREELKGHPRTTLMLRDLIKRSFKMFLGTGRIPDLFGWYPEPKTFKEKHFENSRNILIDLDEDQVFLVDTVCTAKLHSIVDASPRQKLSILNQLRRMYVFMAS